MTKKGVKRKPAYKQMAFETAVRNPERYVGILSELKDFENRILDDDCLLEIVSHLYIVGEVSSVGVEIVDSTTPEGIKDAVIKVNSTRKADGGFPSGYASRFWTYTRTLSELGFVYAQYNQPLEFSEVAKKLIDGDIDEQEAFSIQAMKYNRKSPYRNVSNDYNFFRFALEAVLSLRKKGRSLSYEQFIVLTFSKDGSVQDFLNTISKNTFKDSKTAYRFLNDNYDNVNKFKTIAGDYPDVVRRVLIIAGFITIRYEGKKLIQLNENKIEYIKELLNIKFNLSEEEKKDPKKYFDKLNSINKEYLEIAYKYRQEDVLTGEEYTNKLFEIINLYSIDEKIMVESLEKIGSGTTAIEEFNEIPDPLKLEFFIAILVALKYKDEFYIRPNYKADHIGKPYSHAPGNSGDIDVYSSEVYWLIEVTLIRNRNQQLNHETTSIVRHLESDDKFKKHSYKYLSLIAPVIHSDTREFLEYMLIKQQTEKTTIRIKPYEVGNFIEITMKKENFEDMDKYADLVFKKFKTKLE